ncbi:MAG: 1-acyl-sn-glycerol-3-phosphate acyltransferase [Fuerstiella sp.]|nr:1-acyl-sn-glycerol-3-phosphate acyltransferase [Fuerstiella sp.]
MSSSAPENTSSAPVEFQPNCTWRFLHFILTPFFALWVRTRVVGRENLDSSQGGLLLLNHQSFVDPMVASFGLQRPISYLARDGLFRIPVIGWVLRHTYVQSISQTAFRASSIRSAVDRMHQGFLVGIFPEGERSSGDVKKFKRGFLSLVRRVELPIYPVGIFGTDRVMPRGSIFIRPGKVTVVFGKPLSKEEINQLRTGNDDHQLTELMRKRVADCITEAKQWH